MGDDDENGYGGGRKVSHTDIEKRQEYLSLLQERNRIKKMMTSKTGIELENEEKEKGFMTHFLGANAQRAPAPAPRKSRRSAEPAGASRRAISLPCSEVEKVKDPAITAPRRGWAVGKPKFLFGMRVGDQASHDQKSNSGAPRHSRMALGDEEEDEGDDYGEDFEDMEDYDAEDREGELPAVSVTIADSIGYSSAIKSLGAASGPISSSHEISGGYHITDPFSNIPPTHSAMGPVKSSNPLVFSPSGSISPIRIKSSVPGIFGSPMKLQIGSTPKFPHSENINTKNLSEGFVLSHRISTPAGSEIKNFFEGTSSLAGPPSKLIPFHDEEHSFPAAAAAEHSFPAEIVKQFNGNISIRIRIHNTWKKSKFVSLQCLRLTFLENENDVENSNSLMGRNSSKYWIDLRTFTVRILNGLQQLPSSSEAFRSMQLLLGNSSTSTSTYGSSTKMGLGTGGENIWRAPIGPGNALDIYLEGNLPQQFLGMFFDQESMINSLQLHIWNSSSSSAECSFSPIASSAAKDVDVYLGSVCAWSGTIEQEKNENSVIMVKIGKYIENNIMAVFAPNRTASKIICFGKKIGTKAKHDDVRKGAENIDLTGKRVLGGDNSIDDREVRKHSSNDDTNKNNNNGYDDDVSNDTYNKEHNTGNNNKMKLKNHNENDNDDVSSGIDVTLIPPEIGKELETGMGDASAPSWLVGLRPKTVPIPSPSEGILDFNSNSTPKPRPLSGRRADPKSKGKERDVYGQLLSNSDPVGPAIFDAVTNGKDGKCPKEREEKEKSRSVSASSARKKPTLGEPSITPPLTLPSQKPSFRIEVEEDENENENENENEIGTFPASSSFASEQQASTNSRRQRKKEASESPDKKVIIGKRSSKEVRESDNVLRQSLEAISAADRMTRGRVGGLSTPGSGSGHAPSPFFPPENMNTGNINEIEKEIGEMESESERNSSANPSKLRRPRLTVSDSPAKPNFQKPPIQPHLTAQFNQNISCANSTTSSLKSDSSFFPRASYNSVPPTPDCLDEGIMAALIELENNKTNFNMSNAVKSLRRSSDDELDSAEGGSGGGSVSAGGGVRRKKSIHSPAERDDIVDLRNKRIDMVQASVGAAVADLEGVMRGLSQGHLTPTRSESSSPYGTGTSSSVRAKEALKNVPPNSSSQGTFPRNDSRTALKKLAAKKEEEDGERGRNSGREKEKGRGAGREGQFDLERELQGMKVGRKENIRNDFDQRNLDPDSMRSRGDCGMDVTLEDDLEKDIEREGEEEGEGEGEGEGEEVSVLDPSPSVSTSHSHRKASAFENALYPSNQNQHTQRERERERELEDSLNSFPAGYLDPHSGINSYRNTFKTPRLPCGVVLRIEIYSTWGDDLFVGLNGLDIFDENGVLINSNSSTKSAIKNVFADNRDVLIPTEFQNDPREVSNLMNGTNFTRNDLHVWLAPLGSLREKEINGGDVKLSKNKKLDQNCDQYDNNDTDNDIEGGDNHRDVITSVTITFSYPVTLSLIRVFNYNKSRTHCTRGVRECSLFLDDVMIFEGEIRMATGLLTSAETVSEVLLFTTDSAILEKVAQHDEKAGYYADDTTGEWLEKLKAKQNNARPSTADNGEIEIENEIGKMNEKYEIDSKDSGQLDKDYFFSSGIISFNSSMKTVETNNSTTPPVPNSQMSTLKAKHADSSVFYTPAVSEKITSENKNKLSDPSQRHNSSINSNNKNNEDAAPVARRSTEIDPNLTKSNEDKIVTNNNGMNRKNSIENLFDYELNDDGRKGKHNTDTKLENGNINDFANRKNQVDKNGENLKNKKDSSDFSQTNDLIDFLKEFNNENSVKQNEREKEIEIEKIKKYDAEKENYLKEKQKLQLQQQQQQQHLKNKVPTSTSTSSTIVTVEDADIVTCQRLTFLFESSWGDKNYMGLCGLEMLVGNNCQIEQLTEANLTASPKDLSEIGCFDDARVLGNLINGLNDCCDDKHMWLIPYTIGGTHTLQINFNSNTRVAGFRVWNYNKNLEDSLRGVKTVKIFADNRFIGFSVFRVAPGCDGIEFGQTVFMSDIRNPSKLRMPGLASEIREMDDKNNNDGNAGIGGNNSKSIRYISPQLKQDFEAPYNPSGLLWKFIFYENWFDGYYIGLDAIEMFDKEGNLLNLKTCGAVVSASPHSLRDLEPQIPNNEKQKSDPRTPEKLFLPFRDKDGNKIKEKSSSWLAPLSRSMTHAEKSSAAIRIKQKQIITINENLRRQRKNCILKLVAPTFEELVLPVENVLYVMFPYPVAVSFIRFHNYSKDPSRGVKEFGIHVDHLDLCLGTLQPADRECQDLGGGQSVLFTTDPRIVRNEKDKVNYSGGGETDVLCIDERQVMIRSKSMFQQPNPVAEGMKSDLNARPTTSYQH